MPTASGQYQLGDYLAELQNMGFDGFGTGDLTTYVNRGYFEVARRSRWRWEQATNTFTVAAGATSVQLTPGGAELPNFKTLDRLYVTTANQRRKLRPLSDDEFYSRWLPLDLTAAANRGEPDSYFIMGDLLYVIPPPTASRDFLAYYKRRPVPLVNTIDVPITPQDLDEAILEAAKKRCHERAQEFALVQQSEASLQEIYDDLFDEEESLMTERQERVSPDDQWL